MDVSEFRQVFGNNQQVDSAFMYSFEKSDLPAPVISNRESKCRRLSGSDGRRRRQTNLTRSAGIASRRDMAEVSRSHQIRIRRQEVSISALRIFGRPGQSAVVLVEIARSRYILVILGESSQRK